MADIFLSYAREDLDRVRPLVDALQKEGLTVWWDRELRPGESFEAMIDREIVDAQCVVVVWTERSIASQWVRSEALEALERNVLVPVAMDKVRVPVAFRQLHLADFTRWPDSIATDEYEGFIRAVRGLVSGVAHVTPSEFMGISEMRGSYRRRFRSKRDFITPALVLVTLLFGALLWLRGPREEDAAKPPPRLAVERFSSGLNDDSGFYADSITRELEERLAGRDELELVQTGSTWGMEFVFTDESLLRKSTDFLLKGSVARQDGNLSITASIENAVTGEVDWKGSFIESDDSLLELQPKLMAAVLGVLKLRSKTALSSVLLKPVTLDKAAYRDYLKGKDLLSRGEDHNIRDAIALFEQALARDPTFAMAHAAICRGYLELFRSTNRPGDYLAGRDHCNQALETGEPRADVHLALAELYRASGELDLARLEYLKTLELDARNPDADMGLADVFVQNGNVQAGEEMYQSATRIAPTYWKAHNTLGSFYFRQGMYHKAIESYIRVTELTASNAAAFSNLGAAKLYAGDFVGAYEAFEHANALDTNSASFSNMGTALYLAGRYTDAVNQYKTALRMDTSDHRLWGNVGDTLRFIPGREAESLQAYREAIHLAERVLAINPKDVSTTSRLAVYYAATGQPDKASAMIERAKKMGGDNINVLYDLAVAASLLRQQEATRQYVAAALGAGYPKVLLDSDPQFAQLNQSTGSNE